MNNKIKEIEYINSCNMMLLEKINNQIDIYDKNTTDLILSNMKLINEFKTLINEFKDIVGE